ncbi:N-6 DNA methylase [Novilysobacter arseniciresistens]|uniref:N-6 DNA methylase n=1 Tax=Novilysobacter arseniciresistens TaxID=1385522 RepID=UPI00068C16CD|nr:N-6 DNA methylase [Lysobacter arseniciresistens]
MITGTIKSQVDNIWNAFWAGGIANPMEVIEQMTYLLFIKRLDELHTAKEKKANRLQREIEAPIFNSQQQHLRWSVFKQMGDAAAMYDVVANKVFPFIKSLGEEDSTYATHMKDARFTIPTPALLARVVDMLDAIPMDDRDTKGDLYEYMLGKIASAGQNGQFRTPRHIIKLMVGMMAPKPSDTICDPACGTAGFLVAAAEYLHQHHQQEIYADKKSVQRFNHDTFHGFDFDSTMLRVGSMNMLLHGVENPAIENRDSLSEGHAGVAGQFSLILANPPFSGSLDYDSCAKDLLSVVKTKKTEVLFLALFYRLLKQGGRAAVVVPAGVLESDGKALTTIRQMLIEELRLEAVVKLPHWVFKPYASVDTSILVFSKGGKTDNVWFYRVENDGFADDAQKTPVAGSEISEVLRLWSQPEERARSMSERKHRMVPVEEIRRNGYDLCPPMYLSGHRYPKSVRTAKLGSLFNIAKGSAAAASALEEGPFPMFTSSMVPKRSVSAPYAGPALCIPTVSSTGHGHASINGIHLAEGSFDAASITAVLTPKSANVPVNEIYYYLTAHKDELLVPMMRGATNKSLNIDRLRELDVPLLEVESSQGRAVGNLLAQKKQIQELEIELKRLRAEHKESIEQLRSVLT